MGKRRYIALLFACIIFSLLSRTYVVHAEEDITIHDTDTTMSEYGDEAYDEIRERAEQKFLDKIDSLTQTPEKSDTDPVRSFWVYMFYVYDFIKGVAPALIIGCIVLGALIGKLAKQNKGIRRFGIYGLCVTFPVIILLFIYGMPYLYDVFAKA